MVSYTYIFNIRGKSTNVGINMQVFLFTFCSQFHFFVHILFTQSGKERIKSSKSVAEPFLPNNLQYRRERILETADLEIQNSSPISLFVKHNFIRQHILRFLFSILYLRLNCLQNWSKFSFRYSSSSSHFSFGIKLFIPVLVLFMKYLYRSVSLNASWINFCCSSSQTIFPIFSSSFFTSSCNILIFRLSFSLSAVSMLKFKSASVVSAFSFDSLLLSSRVFFTLSYNASFSFILLSLSLIATIMMKMIKMDAKMMTMIFLLSSDIFFSTTNLLFKDCMRFSFSDKVIWDIEST